MLSYYAWKNSNKVEPILLEQSMVSEVYQYGGRFDFVGKVNGFLTLADFKTGKGIYPEFFYQLAAYNQMLWETKKR